MEGMDERDFVKTMPRLADLRQTKVATCSSLLLERKNTCNKLSLLIMIS